MPRFFFHISNKDIVAEDCEGVDLPDLHAALKRVMYTYRQLALDLFDAHGLELTIADGSGRILLKVPVQDWQQHPPMPLHVGEGRKEWSLASQAVPELLH